MYSMNKYSLYIIYPGLSLYGHTTCINTTWRPLFCQCSGPIGSTAQKPNQYRVEASSPLPSRPNQKTSSKLSLNSPLYPLTPSSQEQKRLRNKNIKPSRKCGVLIPIELPCEKILQTNDLEIGKCLGSGSYGSVYIGLLKSKKQSVAIKRLHLAAGSLKNDHVSTT